MALFPVLEKVTLLLCIAPLPLLWQASTAEDLEYTELSLPIGKIKGFVHETDHGFRARIFLGVPYATPPVGNLRLLKPHHVDPWEDVLDCTHWPRGCVPCVKSDVRSLLNNPENGEDCLYLNVFTPLEKSDSPSGFPVMVYIHGGAYNIGSTTEYGYKGVTANLVSRGVIVVTVQYRMGPLGFLSLGNQELPGNLGYWDQTKALEFVKFTIANFGGDPDLITIFGESAGGGSVGALALAPASRDLFERAIQMSGGTLANWALGDRVVEDSKDLLRAMGCYFEDDTKKMIGCFQEKSVEDIQRAHMKIGISNPGLDFVKFKPRIDGHFFPQSAELMVKEAPVKETIIGLCEKEGGFFSTPPFFLGNMLNVHPSEFKDYSAGRLRKFIRANFVPATVKGTWATQIEDLILQHYFGESDIYKHDYKMLLEKYSEILSDTLFNVPIYNEAKAKAENGWKTWYYSYDYFNYDSLPKGHPVQGAYHTMDLPYIFNMTILGEYKFGEDDHKMETYFADLFTNFAKFGNPTKEPYAGKLEWKRFNSKQGGPYLVIDKDLALKDSFKYETMQFWNDVVPAMVKAFGDFSQQEQAHTEL